MNRLLDIALLFFKLGCTAFGGPAVHIALMEQEVVRRLKWMDRQYFLDLIGVTNLVPGPNSTEMVMQCGMHRGGFPGLVTAGVCFIFPAAAITTVIAFFYEKYGTLPQAQAMMSGIRPVVIVLIVAAVAKLGKQAYKHWRLGVIGLAVAVFGFAGGSEILGIIGGGLLGMLWLRSKTSFPSAALFFAGPALAAVASAPAATLSGIFGSFFKIGATFFGGGYAIFAYFEDEFVNRLGWLSQQNLIDAVAVGQFTPGPVLSSAAFIGYQLSGLPGAAAATVGIFLPSFLIVAVMHPWIEKLRSNSWLSAFLDAVNISAVAVMIAVVVKLGSVTFVDLRSVLTAAIAGIILRLRPNVNGMWLILAGGLAGIFFGFMPAP